MLITDGAPQRYEAVFKKYNKEKKVSDEIERIQNDQIHS